VRTPARSGGDDRPAKEQSGMEKRRAQTTIDRPADEVWARIGDFGDITWIPQTEHCTLDGDLRRVTKDAWDFDLVQRLVEHDDDRRTYSYDLPEVLNLDSLAGPGAIVHVLNGTLTVTPDGESRSTVTWDIETEDFLIGGTHAEYQNALDAVRAELEG
jgi:hypothetical protein